MTEVPEGANPEEYGINPEEYEKVSPEVLASMTGEQSVDYSRKIFDLDGEIFYLDSAPEIALKWIDTVQLIQDEIDMHFKSTEIARIAKNAVIDKLSEMKDAFEKVPEELLRQPETKESINSDDYKYIKQKKEKI